MSDTEFTWLVEAPGPHYLATRVVGRQSEFVWLTDANRALRFYTLEQADGVMCALKKLQPDLFAFASNLRDAKPTQHGFLSRTAA